ncbi:MAG TPA: histidine kinase N-terminal domain-containing protein [Acidimicrobiales bacterium]|nr:histidine kinase N-terminal domain-containing protein [Acidimicrobiales bacterium]
MASLAELARTHSRLDAPRVAHLQRLVASWGPLADLCFADLLLFVPIVGEEGARFVVVGQIRPTTNQTVYRRDFVGEVVDDVKRPLVARAYRSGEIVEGEINLTPEHSRVRILSIPVCFEGEVIGVCSRESLPTIGRQPGELERTYVAVFQRLARMISTGAFPFASEDTETEEAPRVGDGALVLDAAARVQYASPNAVSALHRVGVHASTEGVRLSEIGLEETAIRTAFDTASPVTEEIERGPEITVVVRCVPLIDEGEVTGALVLLRDISELRRRDRLLISMDATIREIHHRVKNNLQTISSLLRLQGRRLESPEAKVAVEESVRRIRSIALVHETLSRATGDDVSFNEIVRPLVRMVEEGLLSPERPTRFSVEGDAGKLPARLATPLAVVLTELLQNAVDHAFPDPPAGESRAEGRVVVTLENDDEVLHITVVDNGVGLPEGFTLEGTTGLGLSIVRSLVTSQIEGSIEMSSRAEGESPEHDGPGTRIVIDVPLGVPQHSGR